MISAQEARRLTKTDWQAELTKIERLVQKGIYNQQFEINYVGELLPQTVEYLINLGYVVTKEDDTYIISWAE